MIFIFISSFVITVVSYRSKIYLFDLHNGNPSGTTVSTDKAVLLKLWSLAYIVNNILLV